MMKNNVEGRQKKMYLMVEVRCKAGRHLIWKQNNKGKQGKMTSEDLYPSAVW